MKRKLRVFIGSSTENLTPARDVQAELEYDAYCEIWNQGVFTVSDTSIEALEKALERMDAAIIVLAPDDITVQRDKLIKSVRDNVLFEFGLFLGKLGRQRTFAAVPRVPQHVLSDLLGMTTVKYDADHPNPRAGLGPACNEIRSGSSGSPRKK